MKKTILILIIAISAFSCKDSQKQAALDQQQREIDSMKTEMAQRDAAAAKQKTIDSMKTIADAREARHREVVAAHSNASSGAAATPAERKRKGWSSPAKGAVIGAGVGALSGAVIDKKHGEGAIVGGLAGAALGAGTGAVIDSKKKKKEEQGQ